MSEYVYRVDTETGLKKIHDRHFRARRWMGNDSYSFPHVVLKQLNVTLPASDGLYRICFYTSLARAKQSLNDDFSYLGLSRILRCPKNLVLSRGFFESWDDGFKEGDAYLFWIQEALSGENSNFSSTGIPFEHFEILNQERWHPLLEYYREMVSVNNMTAIPAESVRHTALTAEKRSWWKFWFLSNR